VWPMVAIGWVSNMVQRGIASTKRILELLNSDPDVTTKLGVGGTQEIKGSISLHNCTFGYSTEGPAVLKSINLDIPAGSSLGIIGKPGSGKTTLASLLLHLYPIDQGGISIDGLDINAISLEQLRHSISYVPQDSFLFSETILNNICFGLQIPDRGKAEAAAKLAAIHDDIMAFPDGYETRVGERGVTLSGGQKQRIALARALLTNGSIMVLDDALSAVDAATEKKILSGLRAPLTNRTSLVIAHRISTVRACDSIIVLADGAIVEQGNHDFLMKQNGFYSTLFRLQHLHETEGRSAQSSTTTRNGF
jgi:ATP-binding cassette subfamily B multidrug efflux pump